MRRLVVLFVLSIAAATSGCVTHETVTRTRAANDFPCEEQQVEVVNIGGTSYRATGCGKQATYNCIGGQQGITCVREEQQVLQK